MSLDWRALTLDDAETWVELMVAMERVDGFGEHYTAEDLADEVSPPSMDLKRDTFAVHDGGELVGFGIISTPAAPNDGAHSLGLWGGVRPSHRRRGIGRELMDRMEARAVAIRRERLDDAPARLVLYALDHHVDRAALFTPRGYSIARWFFDMERDLAHPVEAPVVPADLQLVGYDPARDDTLDDRVRRAHNDAFSSHWGSTQRSESEWAQWFTGNRHFRPDLSFLVLDGDDIAAYALCQRYPEEDEQQGYTSGWLGQLGTRTPWRGRGLGTALLRRVIAAMQADGLERAALNVDTENATGALALYQREGFRTRTERAAFTLRLAPQDRPSASGSQ